MRALTVIFAAIITVDILSRPHSVAAALGLDSCAQYAPDFLPTIWEDLLPFAEFGISPELLAQLQPLKSGDPRARFLIRGGAAFVATEPADLGNIATWHAKEVVMYAHAIRRLARDFVLPDVEFVLSPADRPARHPSAGAAVLPLVRYCKAEGDGEIQVPIFHFYGEIHGSKRRFSNDFLGAAMERTNRQHPWASRRPTVYSSFTMYSRNVEEGECSATRRAGADGAPVENPRVHITEWAANRTAAGDLQDQGGSREVELRIGANYSEPMQEWAKYKYVAHVDGITCSSKLEQTLALGCLVFKEESGYRSFYHRLLRPFVHYVPFWRERPQELLAAVAWARAHDAEAAAIAAAGQQLVARVLTKRGISCYWVLLLHEYAKLLVRGNWTAPYPSGGGPPAAAASDAARWQAAFAIPIGEWLAEVQRDLPALWRPEEHLELDDGAEEAGLGGGRAPGWALLGGKGPEGPRGLSRRGGEKKG